LEVRVKSRLNREVFVVFVGHLLAYAVIYLLAEKAPLATAIVAFMLAVLAGYLWYRERRVRLACVPFGEQILHSQYGFQELAEGARSSIFVVGPSLKFIATEMGVKDALFGKCSKKNFKLRILISNPEGKDICSVLERVSFTPGFSKDLADACEVFQGWKKDATKRTVPLDEFARPML